MQNIRVLKPKGFINLCGNIIYPISPYILCSSFFYIIADIISQRISANEVFEFLELLKVLFSSTFYFLPIIISINAARQLNYNLVSAAILGGFFIYPLLNKSDSEEYINIFGKLFLRSGFKEILPIVFSVIFVMFTEKIIYSIFKKSNSFIIHFICLVFSYLIIFFVFMPILRFLSSGILYFFVFIFNKLFYFSGFFIGFLYSLISPLGLSENLHSIRCYLFSFCGSDILLHIKNIFDISQFSASLVCFFILNKKDEKQKALISSLCCLFGFSAAALFCFNLKYIKPFLCSLFGCAVGSGTILLLSLESFFIKSIYLYDNLFSSFLNNPFVYTFCFFITFLLTVLPLLRITKGNIRNNKI